MSALTLAPGRWWTPSEFGSAASTFDVTEWPAVLELPDPREVDRSDRDADIEDEAGASADVVVTLGRPDVRVEVRALTVGEPAQVCRALIAIRGSSTFLAMCQESRLWVEPVASVQSALHRIVDDHPPVDVEELRCPATELAELLQHCGSEHDLSQAFGALGAASVAARRLARVLATARVVTEIVVARGLAPSHAPPIAFYDAPAGRLLITGRDGDDGVRWSTLTPGTSNRLTQAVVSTVTTSCLTRGGEKGE